MTLKDTWVDGESVTAEAMNAVAGAVNALDGGLQPLDADLTALAALTSPATKLAGIATGATANDTDANLKARANHTGGQAASTISDSTASGRTVLTGTATAGRNALEAASQRIMRPNGPRLGVLGDSLMSFGSASTSSSLVLTNGPTIWKQVEWKSHGRVQMTNPQQDPGDTIDDIINTQLPALLASNPLPNACAIAIGRNDVGSVGFNLAAWVVKLTSVCTQLVNAGIVPILMTMMPTGAAGAPTATATPNLLKVNAAILTLAANSGYPSVDQYAALVDPTGGIATAYSNGTDTTHLSRAGYTAVADSLIMQDVLDLFPPVTLSTVKDITNSFDLIAGAGLFRSATPTGFSVAGTGTSVAYIASDPVDGIAGRWAKVTRLSGSVDGSFRWTSGAVVTPGNVFRFSGALKMDGAWNVDGSPSVYNQIAVQWRNGSTTVSTDIMLNAWDGSDRITYSEDFTAPAGVDGMRVIANLKNAPSADQNAYFAEWSVINLTTMSA